MRFVLAAVALLTFAKPAMAVDVWMTVEEYFEASLDTKRGYVTGIIDTHSVIHEAGLFGAGKINDMVTRVLACIDARGAHAMTVNRPGFAGGSNS